MIPRVVPLPPPQILRDPHKVDAWYASLSPTDRGRYRAHLESLIDAMGPARQALFKKILQHMEAGDPIPTHVGLGFGAGAMIGSLTSAAMQVGTSVYNSRQQAELQKDLARDQSSLQKELAKLETQALIDTQKMQVEAQREAARLAAQAQVESARVGAQRDIYRYQSRSRFWDNHGNLLIGGGVAVVGGGVLLYALSKRKGR